MEMIANMPLAGHSHIHLLARARKLPRQVGAMLG